MYVSVSVTLCGCTSIHAPFLFPSGQAAGRSINLALSQRGIEALKHIRLDEKVLAQAIPMRGRMIHPLRQSTYVVPYGARGECINSIDRKKLNELLLTKAESLPNVTLHFEHKLTRINFESMMFTFTDMSTPVPQEVIIKHDFVFGCDGAFSIVRCQMMPQSPSNFEQEYIDKYKELTMPPNQEGEFAMEPNYLHIWAKGTFMMIALPNQDKTFTLTLFMPFSKFSEIKSEEDACPGPLQEPVSDAISKIGEDKLVKDFVQNPTSNVVSVKCEPHYIDDGVVMLGDVAHAMVPFYGQGMNCGFEDCLVFWESLKKCDNNLTLASKLYSGTRVPDAHAICDLSMDNYIEMRSHINSLSFLMKRRIFNFLHRLFPKSVIPLYQMVAFSRLPYHKVVSRNKRQDLVLNIFLIAVCLLIMVGLAILVYRFIPEGLLLRDPNIRRTFEF